jgi:quercetin dioxygenase-like cupin family protein
MNKETFVVVTATLVVVACSPGTSGVQSSGKLRLTPADLAAHGRSEAVAPGTSAVQGIETAYVAGDPTAPGIYTIMLRVPANTRIAAHSHPDDRVATVVSGTWYFGYGSKHDDAQLRPLPPGSFYTEPPAVEHFARTGETPVVLLITGYGPTGTQYVDESHDPRR